ncbi:MAG: helicase-related protein, partial [Patescibacteria group bacterium]
YNYDDKQLPKIFVVVPTIAIAEDQHDFLNKKYLEFSQLNEVESHSLFGCKSAKGSSNYNAPIQFVTTGVFEAMASNNSFVPGIHSILIDEAHKTLETSIGFEIGLTNTKYRGIRIDYMSATVDTEGLASKLGVEVFIKADAIRHPIFKHNTQATINDSILDVLDKCLVNFTPNSPYFPKGLFLGRDFVGELMTEWEYRPSAMLAIVNSKKDTLALTEIVKAQYPSLPILHYSSAHKKNPKTNDKFLAEIAKYTQKKQNYLIISTNVVEMGVTFDNLDWVITKDQELFNDERELVLKPLKVNSLYQRLGRVGRKGVGIGLITNDGGSYYSKLDDNELNTLTNEPICFPCSKGAIDFLAINTLYLGWKDEDLVSSLIQWNSPSQAHLNTDTVNSIITKRKELIQTGLSSKNDRLSKLGKTVHQLMLYTGLTASNCRLIAEAYFNQDWARFSFEISKSIVELYSYADFKIKKSELTNGSTSVIEIYNYICDFVSYQKLTIQPDIPNYDSSFEDCRANTVLFGDALTVEYVYDSSNETKEQRVHKINNFYNELLTLTSTVLNAFAKLKSGMDFPTIRSKKEGKNWIAKKINLQRYSGEYVPDLELGWVKVQLTGQARLAESKHKHSSLSIPEDLESYNSDSGLEYQWVEVDGERKGWINPFVFPQLTNPEYGCGQQFLVLIKAIKNFDLSIRFALTHALFEFEEKAVISVQPTSKDDLLENYSSAQSTQEVHYTSNPTPEIQEVTNLPQSIVDYPIPILKRESKDKPQPSIPNKPVSNRTQPTHNVVKYSEPPIAIHNPQYYGNYGREVNENGVPINIVLEELLPGYNGNFGIDTYEDVEEEYIYEYFTH